MTRLDRLSPRAPACRRGRASLVVPTAALAFLAFVCPARAVAQRAGENPVRAAEDAFGLNVSGIELGLYGPNDVRGFSPLVAGNVRLEGLTIDRQADFTSRLVSGNTIRVGPSTLGYPFPAPTGIADYRLRPVGGRRIVSLATRAHAFGGGFVEADAQLPLRDSTLGVGTGVGLFRNAHPDGANEWVASVAVAPRWQPRAGIEIRPFWSRVDGHGREAGTVLLVEGTRLPPRVSPRLFLGQPWAQNRRANVNYGVVASATAGSWDARAGVFRSERGMVRTFSSLLRLMDDGTAERTMTAMPSQRFASTSGEGRVTRRFGGGTGSRAVRHALTVAVRGRAQARRYGGADEATLDTVGLAAPPGPSGAAPSVPAPSFHFGAQSRDRVGQWSVGLAYDGRWGDVAGVSVGAQRVRYRKSSTTPTGTLPTTRDGGWFPYGVADVRLTSALALYGGYARGLEEGPVAPEFARNRDAAPPALHTTQGELGVRWRPVPAVRAVAGVFRIEKPYYALDETRLFRRLGSVRHRGAEFSLTADVVSGLRLVTGAVLLAAAVDGTAGDSTGRVGVRPVGAPERVLLISADYAPPFLRAVSLDVAARQVGSRAADARNTLALPPRTTVDVGARLRFHVQGAAAMLRLEVSNLGNVYGWDVPGSGTLGILPPREVAAGLTIDL